MTARLPAAAALVLLLLAPIAGANGQAAVGWHEATAGSQLEDYLRALQTAARSERYPVSLRGYSPQELERISPPDSMHPWGGQLALREGRRFLVRRPELRALYNSAGPWGENDGAVWAGRGFTAVASAGVVTRAGPLSVELEPIVFWSQNAPFTLLDNGAGPERRFAHQRYPTRIDYPQRFGDSPVARVDPGQSTVRVEAGGFGVGVSTANEIWGPAVDFPLVLGPNAPGIPRLFIGTSAPVNVLIGRIHARVMAGALGHSPYAPARADSARRVGSGLVMIFVPRWLPSAEVGAVRFFHSRKASGFRIDDLLTPFGGFAKGLTGVEEAATDNEISSVFFRVGGRGAEVYGEFAKDDHSYAAPGSVVVREMITQPDHASAFMLGLRRVWDGGAERLTSARLELMNARASHLQRTHAQAEVYIHSGIPQGHTHRGQLLGSPLGFGGEALALTVDRYTRGGRMGARLTRVGTLTSGERAGGGPRDVVYSLEVGGTRFVRAWELGVAVTGAVPMDRSVRPAAGGLGLAARVRHALR